MDTSNPYIDWLFQEGNVALEQVLPNDMPLIDNDCQNIMTTPDNLIDSQLLDYIIGEPNKHYTAPEIVIDACENKEIIFHYNGNMPANNNADFHSPKPPAQSSSKARQRKVSRSDESSTAKGSVNSDDDEPTEMQWKSMSSSERRQIRNKISARNFRNRRKEYVTTLESEVETYKAENGQLKLEVQWMRTTMKKMQEENDRLRVDLLLFKAGVQPEMSANNGPSNVQQFSSLPWDDNTFTQMSLPRLSSPNGDTASPADSSSDDNFDNWNLYFPRETYLNHVALPSIDLNSILSEKDRQALSTMPSSEIFRRYPLLAPALMSIVLEHTVQMSANQFFNTSRLLPPSSFPSPNVQTNYKQAFNLIEDFMFTPKFNSNRSTSIKNITEDDIRRMWENMVLANTSSKEDTKDTVLVQKDNCISRAGIYCLVTSLSHAVNRLINGAGTVNANRCRRRLLCSKKQSATA
ncbi:hypothetical protein BDF14DRAFT_1756370 [Spinellus fusiger]|nr:hypothetical protein BDF14DRAFT_1756370 [Spinellus fusiger]